MPKPIDQHDFSNQELVSEQQTLQSQV